MHYAEVKELKRANIKLHDSRPKSEWLGSRGRVREQEALKGFVYATLLSINEPRRRTGSKTQVEHPGPRSNRLTISNKIRLQT